MKVLYLVDTKEYVESNCFQQQLLRAFRYCHDLTILPIAPISLLKLRWLRIDLLAHDVVVSVLRQRTLDRLLPRLYEMIGGHPIAVYDQDPWEAYIDGSATKGFYSRLNDTLNAQACITSAWWVERLRRDGIRAHFIRMGMEPRSCDVGPNLSDRPIPVGFRGHVHPHRKVVLDSMAASGLEVSIGSGRLDYPQYLDYLQQVQVFTHDESAPWICDGEEVSRSTGMWVKDIETAARGTFVLRNWHPEAASYDLESLPTMLFYRDPAEAKDLVLGLAKFDPGELRQMQHRAVDNIRSRQDWAQAAHTIANTVVLPT